MHQSENKQGYDFIRGALRANAAFSVLTSLPLLGASGAMAGLLGVGAPWWVLPALGVSLLGFAGFVWWVAGAEQPSIKLVNTVSAMDVVWVLASAEILLFELISLSTWGKTIVIVVALFVTVFAAAQITGVWRLRRARLRASAHAL